MRPQRLANFRSRAPSRGQWCALLAVVVLSLGCVGRQPPTVDVGGQPSAILSLVGLWRGEYSSAVTRRSGVIRFDLAPDGLTALGQVTMTVATDPVGDANHRPDTVLAPLSIHLVQIDEEGTIAGALEPYRDPECNCLLSTTFVGRLAGDRITGRFVTNGGPGHPASSGRWQVDRQ